MNTQATTRVNAQDNPLSSLTQQVQTQHFANLLHQAALQLSSNCSTLLQPPTVPPVTAATTPVTFQVPSAPHQFVSPAYTLQESQQIQPSQ